MTGISVGKSWRVWRTVSYTKSSSWGFSNSLTRLTPSRSLIGLWMTGPSPAANYRSKPSGTKIGNKSEKMIAASTPNRSTAVHITSLQSCGLWQSSRKECFALTSRYSCMYRPACRINHIGGGSTRSPFSAAIIGLEMSVTVSEICHEVSHTRSSNQLFSNNN